jgi:glutamyl-tRNA reductase
MNIIAIGLNHKTAPLDIRERLAFGQEKLKEALKSLGQLPSVNEVALLSTCNRVEIYASVKDGHEASGEITDFISSFHGIPADEFSEMLYVHRNEAAARHLLRVASSLDSMIPGEPQILGQVKDAFKTALSCNATGFILNRLMRKAISTAKRVRTETKIAESAVSISFAAVELAKKIFGELAGKSVMLLGAGEMAELAARHLMTNGVRDIKVANRTYERGLELASAFRGTAVRFEDLKKELAAADILICAANAPSYIVSKDMMTHIMKERKFRPVFMIDISAPRNIDPKANGIDNVYLYNIDDLQRVVGSNMNERKKEADKAEDIVNGEVDKFRRWFSSLESFPVVIALRQRAEEIKNDELSKFIRRFPDLDNATLSAVEHLADAITNKLTHDPSVAIKSDDENRALMVYIARKLYGLDGNDDE